VTEQYAAVDDNAFAAFADGRQLPTQVIRQALLRNPRGQGLAALKVPGDAGRQRQCSWPAG
jgi:hypothetical protein